MVDGNKICSECGTNICNQCSVPRVICEDCGANVCNSCLSKRKQGNRVVKGGE